MRAITLLLTLAISLPLAAAADENDAIVSLIERNVAAFRDFDADGASSTYADDADWTNAFGVRQHGRSNIRTYLSNLFARPEFRSRSQSGPAELSVRFVRPDVAVAHRFTEVVGQRGSNGEKLPPRKIHRLIVLTKDAANWLILSELVMDERQDRIVR